MPIASNDRPFASDDEPRRIGAAGAGSASAAAGVGTNASDGASRVAERVQAVPGSGHPALLRHHRLDGPGDFAGRRANLTSLHPGPSPKPAFARSSRVTRNYTSNLGLLELREAVAADLERRYGIEWDPREELLITTGVSEGLDLAARAIINPGDEVIVADPSYAAQRAGGGARRRHARPCHHQRGAEFRT